MRQASRRTCAPFTKTIRIRRPSTTSRNIGPGKIRKSAARSTICSGLREPSRKTISILVAGCGTSQAAKHAMRWPAARVTGIDFSETSVRCTEELKRKYKLDNLQVHRLPIERARELETRFDQIVCTGVLHHLPDPDAGLALFARRARAGRGDARHGVCAVWKNGHLHAAGFLQATSASVPPMSRFGISSKRSRRCRQDIRCKRLLRDAPDFRNEAALADALLHPCDRAYSVPQLLDFLERGGLRFGRWARQAAYSPYCGVLAHLRQAARLQAVVRRRISTPPANFSGARCFVTARLRTATTPPTV